MIPIGLFRLIRERRRSGERKPVSRGAHGAYRIILGVSVLNLLFMAGVALWGEQPNILLDPSSIIKVVFGLGVLSAGLTVGALTYTLLAWKNRCWGIAGRTYYTLVTVTAIASVWLLNYWNLLGWRY